MTAGREESLEAGLQLLAEKSLPQLCVRQGQEPVKPLSCCYTDCSMPCAELCWPSPECSGLLGAARLQSGDRQQPLSKPANLNYRLMLNLQPPSLTYFLSCFPVFPRDTRLAVSLGNVPARGAVVGWEVWRPIPTTSPSYRDIPVERWRAPPCTLSFGGFLCGLLVSQLVALLEIRGNFCVHDYGTVKSKDQFVGNVVMILLIINTYILIYSVHRNDRIGS